MRNEISEQALAGIGFLFEIAYAHEQLEYADEYTKEQLHAAGEWYRSVKNSAPTPEVQLLTLD